MRNARILVVLDTSMGERVQSLIERRRRQHEVAYVVYDSDYPDTKPDCWNRIANLGPQVLISVYSDLWIPGSYLDPIRVKINFHPTTCLRPGVTYGVGPILDGDKELGSTLHYMTKKLDRGRIIEERRCGLTGTENYLELRARAQAFLLEQLESWVDSLFECKELEEFEAQLEQSATASNLQWGHPYIGWDKVNETLLAQYLLDPGHRVFYGNAKFQKYLRSLVRSHSIEEIHSLTGGKVLLSAENIGQGHAPETLVQLYHENPGHPVFFGNVEFQQRIARMHGVD